MKILSAKILYNLIGLASLALGIIGAFLPGLPTTVFLIIAAYFFAKSNPALYQKLINHKKFGPIITAWEKGRVVPKKAKTVAISSMTISGVLILATTLHLITKCIILLLLLGCAIFLLLCPSS